MNAGKRMLEMNQGDLGLMLNICLALKPMAEVADEYDRQNSYRPDYPAEVILHIEGDKAITMQHCFNAQKLLKELTS